MVIGGWPQFTKKEGESIFEFQDSDKNKLYSLVHLAPNNNLFIFANGKLIMLDHVNMRVVRRYPDMPAYSSNNYPTSASSYTIEIGWNMEQEHQESIGC